VTETSPLTYNNYINIIIGYTYYTKDISFRVILGQNCAVGGTKSRSKLSKSDFLKKRILAFMSQGGRGLIIKILNIKAYTS